MTRCVAFLRAINVGGHTVTMDRLRAIVASAGVSNVETFIASGNVVFDTRARAFPALEEAIASRLRGALGYEVATFIRTAAEVSEIAAHRPFPETVLAAAVALNVGFLAAPLDAASKHALGSLRTDHDDFHVRGREIYWVCRRRQSESTISNAVLERALRRPATFRGINTVRKLAAKYSAA